MDITKTIQSVALSPGGKTKTVKLWDLASQHIPATLKGHGDSIWSLAFSPDNKTLASAGGDTKGKKDFAIRLWFAATEEEVARQRSK